jgi:hypothetical protein
VAAPTLFGLRSASGRGLGVALDSEDLAVRWDEEAKRIQQERFVSALERERHRQAVVRGLRKRAQRLKEAEEYGNASTTGLGGLPLRLLLRPPNQGDPPPAYETRL